MRKTIIKGIVCVIVFFLSLFSVSAIMNKGNTDMTVEMSKATFPLVYMEQDGRRINSLHGYAGKMQGSALRDTITPLGEGRSLSVSVEKFGMEIRKLSFEVRSIDGERLVENTDIFNYTEDGDIIQASFSVKDLIEENEEYNLILLLETEEGREIRYYTRIIQAPEYHVREKLDFARDFHTRTFDKEAAKELTKYLESNAEGDNSSYSHVDIHSSFQQITWGELAVEKITEPLFYLQEVGPSTANIRVSYVAGVKENRHLNYYNISEFYRVRYTDDRMYLLDFEREMHQMLDAKADVFVNNKIILGITDPDVELMESDGGNVLAFVNENKLYSYNISDNKFATLFGFYDEDNSDERCRYSSHDIKILNVDETENVQFLVYGYMNRGRHEGQVGVQVYYYNSMLNTIEEQVFIPDDRSYEMLRADMERLSYMNKNNNLFLMIDGSVYEVNLENKSYKAVVADLTEEGYKVSDSNRMIVWKNNKNSYDNTELVLMNLNSKKKTLIKAASGEIIMPLGFMEEDLIYGVADRSDIVKDSGGKVLIPMNELKIQNEKDEVLKTYRRNAIYIVDASILDNQITLKRVKKDEENGNYVPVRDDHIMNNEEAELGVNRIETAVTEDYETIVQIAVKSNIPKKSIKFLTPKEVLFEGGREVVIDGEESPVEHYYVYGKKGIEGTFTDPGNAINIAEGMTGVVVNDRGGYVWVPGNRSLKNQIMKIKEAVVSEERNSLAVCLDTILEYEGISRNTAYMLEHGGTALSILESNLPDAQVLELSGCSLNSILYYVNRDIPVLAMLNDGNAVLIIGFNELNTVLMDPQTGEIYKKGMNDSTEWFAQNGNSFITYVKN